ncbi:hypothetical protein [Massilia sp. S19_KUP03_FR1]|uniref:hypothetical protein n=1 Tax=Massilia sp. S19_KUP03_FR1 TaxID=3025503 RepID=UPI002FCCF6CA
MTPELLLKTAIVPALAYLHERGIEDKLPARRLMLAIALQESGLRHRRQVVSDGSESGPASSFWQFEAGGGCNGMLTHRTSAPIMRQACADFNVAPTPAGLWEAMRYNDVLAAIAARLMIYVLPSMLPERVELGYQQYINAWRPGKPKPATWSANWSTADNLLKGAA